MGGELFPQYLYPRVWKRLDTADIRTMTVIGYMKSGKTVFVEHVAARAFKELVVRCELDDSQFVFLRARSLRQAKRYVSEALEPSRLRYLLVFVDDALSSAHSRQKNVEETTLFAEARHWSLSKGVIALAYATQDFKLLDKLMRYAQVYAWKTLPLEFYLEKEAKAWVLRYVGLAEAVQLLQQITWQVYSIDPNQVMEGLRKAVIRIPVQNYGPKVYDGIPKEQPPRHVTHNAWELEDEGEGEVVNNNIDVKWARALARALIRLAQVTGASLRVNRQRYIVAKVRINGETKELSLGPIAELLEELGVEWRKRFPR